MIERILLILKTKNISSSQFADEIGVQRSNISHILSGRNKPSLEFVKKILERYKEINMEWLINGKGSMQKEMPVSNPDLFTVLEKSTAVREQQETQNSPEILIDQPVITSPDKTSERLSDTKHENIPEKNDLSVEAQEVEKIVILYRNKTFKVYQPE